MSRFTGYAAATLAVLSAAATASPPAAIAAGTTKLGSGTMLMGAAPAPGGGVVAVGETGAGRHARLLLERFLPNGRPDRAFGTRGTVTGPLVRNGYGSGSIGRAVAIAPGGDIVVAGTATSSDGSSLGGLLVERFTDKGALDRSFGKGGVVTAFGNEFGNGYAVAVGSSGEILAAGAADAAGSGNGVYPRVAIVSLKPDGALNRSFAGKGSEVLDLGPYSSALAMALAPHGKIVIAGSTSPNLRDTDALVARLTSAGRLDRGFNGTGEAVRQDSVGEAYSAFGSIAVAPDGQILAGGSATASGEDADAILARFSTTGGAVASWGSRGVSYVRSATHYLDSSGTVPGIQALAVTGAGVVVAAGQTLDAGERYATVWRFTARGALSGSARKLGPLGGSAAGLVLGKDGRAALVGDVAGQLPGQVNGLLGFFSLG